MLILARKIEEKILLGDDIVLTIVKLNSSYVRIGIDAPPNVKILRPETITKRKMKKEAT